MELETEARCDFESLCVGFRVLLPPRGITYSQTPGSLDKLNMFVVRLGMRRFGRFSQGFLILCQYT